MNRKSIVVILVVVLVVVSFMLMSISPMKMSSKPAKPHKKGKDEIKIVKVDKVARDPDSYNKEYFGIEGDVLKVYTSDNKFFLSCGDSCVRLPVKYEGKLPKEKAKIIAYGKIKTSEDGGYIFIAEKVEVK